MIKIRNFKSIKEEITLKINSNFNFMIGLNGSGKSNIIEAINLINFKNKPIKYRNYSYNESNTEKLNDNIDISYYLNKIIDSDLILIEEILKKTIFKDFLVVDYFMENKQFELFINKFSKKIKEIIELEESFIRFSISNNDEKASFLSSTSIVIQGLNSFISDYYNKTLSKIDKYYSDKNLEPNKDDLEEPNKDDLEEPNKDDLEEPNKDDLEKNNCIEILTKHFGNGEKFFLTDSSILIDFSDIFKIRNWVYDKKYILSGEIDLKSFIKKPEEISIPLSNILKIIDIDPTDILEKSNDNIQRSVVSDKLNEKVNKIFEEKWPDFKKSNLEFKFLLNAGKIDITIKNKGIYNNKPLSAESDGYKQYISILCTLGLENMENTLLTIDEPEIHLHPSSIFSIKDVLKNIGHEKNVCILGATHSPQMIELNNLDNYFQVWKNDKYITNINSIIDNADIEFPDIIQQSFGTDIFSNYMFKKYSIIVEGEGDYKIIKDIFNENNIDCLLQYGYGAGNIPKILKSWKTMYPNDYYNNNCFVILDGDGAGDSCIKVIYEKELLKKEKIIRISDFSSNDIKTIETFLSKKDQEEFNKIPKKNKKEIQNFKSNIYKKYLNNKNTDECKKNIEKFLEIIKSKGINND